MWNSLQPPWILTLARHKIFQNMNLWKSCQIQTSTFLHCNCWIIWNTALNFLESLYSFQLMHFRAINFICRVALIVSQRYCVMFPFSFSSRKFVFYFLIYSLTSSSFGNEMFYLCGSVFLLGSFLLWTLSLSKYNSEDILTWWTKRITIKLMDGKYCK